MLPSLKEEDQLLQRARRADRAAWGDIHRIYYPAIYRYIHFRIGDAATAEDLSSEVFLKLLENVNARSGPRKTLRGWLFQVARNLVADFYRRRQRHEAVELGEWTPAGEEADPERHLLHRASTEDTRRALNSLTPEQQEVLELRYGQQLSLKETAEIMGRRVGAVKGLQFRALDALRSALNVQRASQRSVRR